MDTTSRHPTKYNENPEPGHPPSGPQEPIGEHYWTANFTPSTPVTASFKQYTGFGDPPGCGNNELQYYTADTDNSFHRGDKKLVIRAVANSNRPDPNPPFKYTSARLTSLQTLTRQRGYLAVVLTPPCASGVWPAFWMLPKEPFQWPAKGEVDIFESWNGDLINHSSLHWGQFNGQDFDKYPTIERATPGMARPEGNMFSFAWDQQEYKDGSPGRLVWYLDGTPVMKASIPTGTRKMSNFTILVNVAIGGSVVRHVAPVDGVYGLVVHSLALCNAPPGGCSQFDNDYDMVVEGHTM